MRLRLGISPCPNDTFMFYYLLHSGQFAFDLTIADVEVLNEKVCNYELDISKVSMYTAAAVDRGYTLLDAGATLGSSCGPLLVKKAGKGIRHFEEATVGIPGHLTTAHLLFCLFGKNRGEKVFMPFHQIMPAVRDGQLDFGVVIHEGRFTYRDYGLALVADLGEWWEKEKGLPLPLGGVVARRTLPLGIIQDFTQALRDSIKRALEEKGDFSAPVYTYVMKYAQEVDMEVIARHINLYVSDYSLSLGEFGKEAVKKLFQMAKGHRL